MKKPRSHITLLSVITIGSILFLYTGTKAYVSSFTHDESISYLIYGKETFMEIISYSNWYTNNHPLNSLMMKYSEQLFGHSELALRLPNLLLLLVYMVYGHGLFRGTNAYLTIAMFSLLCTNCLLMDLFGMARGYGMSCGFMLMSLYHFIEYIRDGGSRDVVIFHAAALLACLSNFTLLTFYIAMLLVYNLYVFVYSKFVMDEKYRFLKSNRMHIMLLLLVTIVLFEPVRRLVTYNKLDFGGKTGFYADTINHLIWNTLHGISLAPFARLVLQLLFTFLVLISLFIIVRMTIRKNKAFFEQYAGLIVSCFSLIFISVIIILSHVIFGADYPIARFSIFLFPLFMVHLGFLIHYLMSVKYEKVMLAVISGLALASVISFVGKADLYAYAEWAYDRNTKNMVQTLASHREKHFHGNETIELGVDWLFEPTVNYYKVTMGMDWLLPVDRNGCSEHDDYCYLFKDELGELDVTAHEIIKAYDNTNTLLIMKQK